MGVDRPSSEVLALEVDAGVATLVLDRPEKRNALGTAFWTDLPRFMAHVDQDDEVRCVVLAAEGPHFSVGLDLSTFGAQTAPPSGSAGRVAANRGLFESVLSMQASVTSIAV
ncbi:MAG TPA: enoyl-CoA hydratase-related protein, partial [Acidimicrobiales bacterium]|nr:enoyl-CoA hydratase-related protein [Acidimicrobiales bacterium]